MDIPTMRDIAGIRCLELLAETRHDGNGWVTLGTIAEWFEGDDDAGRAWAARQERLGHVRDDGSLGALKSITDEGLAYLDSIRAQRNDKGLRRRVCRQRLLHWVDSAVTSTADLPVASEFLASEHAWFAGEMFTAEELGDATGYLVDKGLLRGVGKIFGGSYARIGITHEGQECVTDFGADPAAYLAQQRQGVPTVNIHGEGNALSFALGANSSATATATTINLEAALQLARAVREASPILDLAPEDEEALRYIEQREDEGKVRRGLQWFSQWANNASAGALGSFIGSVAFALLHMQ